MHSSVLAISALYSIVKPNKLTFTIELCSFQRRYPILTDAVEYAVLQVLISPARSIVSQSSLSFVPQTHPPVYPVPETTLLREADLNGLLLEKKGKHQLVTYRAI